MPTLRFAERLAAMAKPVWVRYVLVPGLTDDPSNVGTVARFVAPMKNVEWVEVLPFHQMGTFKWKTLGLEYQLANAAAPTRRPGASSIDDLSRAPAAGRAERNIRGDVTLLAEIADLLGSQPILALFLAVALGYAVGQINILGFSLGIGAVLFVGLAIGAIAPKAQIAGPIGLIGLVMFLYGIGTLYGRQFFEGLSGPGRRYNLLAFVAILAGLLVALALGRVFAHRHRRGAGRVRRLDDQHADPAGGARPARQQVAVDRLLGRPTRSASSDRSSASTS